MTGECRPPAVRPAMQAGRFYEADPRLLRMNLKTMLDQAAEPDFGGPPLALLAPHAGCQFSGSVAAAAYATLQGHAYDHVLILAPTHYGGFTGAALSSMQAFATPLGRVPLDTEAVAALSAAPGFLIDDEAHQPEHAIEVQLPFLQTALEAEFTLLPVLLGRTEPPLPDRLASRLATLLEQRRAAGERWLLVASSDTYHGHDAAACRANDAALTPLIERLAGDELADAIRHHRIMACGWLGLVMTLNLLRGEGAQGRVLARSDSDEARGTGAGGYVVGYIGASFGKKTSQGVKKRPEDHNYS